MLSSAAANTQLNDGISSTLHTETSTSIDAITTTNSLSSQSGRHGTEAKST